MDPTRVILAGGWISLMLVYLLGDVLRIFAGDAEPGRIGDRAAASWMWVLAALIMLVPIAMITISLMVPATPLKWITVIVSAALVLFNLAALPYKGLYDNVLIVVGFGFNALLIWVALAWHPAQEA
ncbi:hypothetical protein PX701_04455 [Agromyces sp. H3Y2-19a]|jgi:hypothetical protein|uniref:hypothetical protein n=1 Tax=Agromyces TaxID=33877 RepID=UPI0023B9376A|nr:hypothetical protein [Agromyces chromiiresistens]MDF0512866.1 hypothetical protein [Agromyces chromiiresistens]